MHVAVRHPLGWYETPTATSPCPGIAGNGERALAAALGRGRLVSSVRKRVSDVNWRESRRIAGGLSAKPIS